MAALYHGLMPYLEDLLAANHLGVIIKLAEMCLKMGTKQEKLLKVRTSTGSSTRFSMYTCIFLPQNTKYSTVIQ